MGLGDWVMCTGQVRRINESTGQRVHVVSPSGKSQWSPVFENNPRIAPKDEEGCAVLVNAGGARPYIKAKGAERWIWKAWDIAPGELFLSDAERDFAAPFTGRILIEPNTKQADGNKAWAWERWLELTRQPDLYIQTGVAQSRRLPGVQFVETTFRQACAVLAVSRGFVGTEGALHHAAAALGVPAVVLWSEFIDPRFTGYATQTNLRHADRWCGSRLPCAGCKASMEAITVEEVRNAMEVL